MSNLPVSIPAILLGGIVALLFWQVGGLLSLGRWVDHTDQVIAITNLFERQVFELENGIRGYVITGNVDFLQPYLRAKTALPVTIEKFRKLTAGNRGESGRMDRVAADLTEWENVAKKIVDQRKLTGSLPTLEQSRRVDSMLDSIQGLLAEVRSGEEDLRSKRVSTAHLESRRIFWTLIIASLLLLSVLLRNLRLRRKWEGTLRESEAKYRNLIVNAHDGIAIVAEDGTIEFVNMQIEAMFGYTSKELKGQLVEILVPDRVKQNHGIYRAQFTANPYHRAMGSGLELSGRRKDGTEFPIDLSLSQLKTEQKSYVTAIVRDMTESKEIEKERAQILIQERKANLVKDEFLAILSHELRTPLTTILAWAQMLRLGKLNEETTKRGIEILEQSAIAQGQLIDDLLDVSRIQAGKLSLFIQEVDPAKVIMAAVESIRSLAVRKFVEIDIKTDPKIKKIEADPTRLQQILWNLISNAIKFSVKGGHVWVSLDSVSSPEAEGIRIQVRDDGKGISPDFMKVIFDRFTQADSTSTRLYNGLGLGLAIVRNLVEMHHGTIDVESPGEGKGAIFTVFLPLKSHTSLFEKEIKNETSPDVNLNGVRVLVVDDEPNARDVFKVMLQSFGAEVKTVQSAAEALAVFEEYKCDVLVSDIAMPVEDGHSLIRKIRQLKSRQAQTPALALTAFAGSDDVDRARLAGFDSHISKPVDSIQLARMVARLASYEKSSDEFHRIH